MEYIITGIKEAFDLLLSFDGETYKIIFLSIYVSFFSTIISSLIAVPIGLVFATKEFRLKKLWTRILYTLMGIPPVVVGLIVSLFLSRRGPLGELQLMFTPTAMIIAQSILVIPIITGIIFNNFKEKAGEIINVSKTLGAGKFYTFILLINEMRVYVLIALVTGFGRAISEVGAVMIVGGNIKGHTRVMTSFIAMNNSMGNYSQSIAMGFVLLTLSFVTNSMLYMFGMED
ncbi:ABC transporter permease [Oceanirhabdus seepicola]|uniref:ABC transporter permease n=1 Tax=Oceanirhabdus seepicola TaxID=2828781 RepID=A0A9J6P6Z9_9CLOT|nr:ABC transporter permease [Oceanirhabdus seepicola]MCM1992543.1 ABC transporter permease [Oceanirhabdus seepicola]